MRSKFRHTSAQTMCHIASDHANFSNAHAFSRINRTATGSNGIPSDVFQGERGGTPFPLAGIKYD